MKTRTSAACRTGLVLACVPLAACSLLFPLDPLKKPLPEGGAGGAPGTVGAAGSAGVDERAAGEQGGAADDVAADDAGAAGAGTGGAKATEGSGGQGEAGEASTGGGRGGGGADAVSTSASGQVGTSSTGGHVTAQAGGSPGGGSAGSAGAATSGTSAGPSVDGTNAGGNAGDAKAELGEACETDEECGSTHCVTRSDGTGLCCDATCDGLCEACGSDGRCNTAPADDARCVVDCPESSACAMYPADPTTDRCSAFRQCVSEQAACPVQYVPDGETCGTNRVCDGEGKCVLRCPTATGAGRVCTAECPCGTGQGACTSNADCSAGLLCSVGAGRKFGFDGNTCLPTHCDNDVQDGDETSQDCGGECGCTATLEWFETKATIEALSDDGSTIVGYTSGSTGHAVYWDDQLVRHDLEGTRAYGVNASGSVIVGYSSGPARWLDRKSAPVLLGATVFASGWANAASADGTTIVGRASDDGTHDKSAAFVWRNGIVSWKRSFHEFVAISAAGTRVAGYLMAAEGNRGEPAIETESGMSTIQLPDGWNATYVYAISRDGSWVIGLASPESGGDTLGYLWHVGAEAYLLEGLDNTPYPYVVADTGLVVGQSGYGGMPANYWAPEEGYVPRLLTDLMAAHGLEPDPALTMSGPIGITPDGRTMVGTGTNGGYRLTLD